MEPRMNNKEIYSVQQVLRVCEAKNLFDSSLERAKNEANDICPLVLYKIIYHFTIATLNDGEVIKDLAK